jgi:hypothetical protein
VSWGQIEILAYGNEKEPWIVGSNTCYATPGLLLRLTEGAAVAYVLCVSKSEYMAWIAGGANREEIYPSYTEAIRGAFGEWRESGMPWKKIGNPEFVFTSILSHFVVGTPLTTNETFHITAEGERLCASPVEK